MVHTSQKLALKSWTSLRWTVSSLFIAPLVNQLSWQQTKLEVGCSCGTSALATLTKKNKRKIDRYLVSKGTWGSLVVKTLACHIEKKDNIVQINFIPVQVYTVPGWRWSPVYRWIPGVARIDRRPQLHLWLLPKIGKPGRTYTGLYSRQINASCTGLWIKPSCSKPTYLI